jgi:RHS repeat-associated protein
VFDVQITRDNLGRIATRTETVDGFTRVWAYTYDLAGRLWQVHSNGDLVAQYTYDANGNRTATSGPGGPVTATYDAQDRLLTSGGTTYTYTANGELATSTTAGQTTTYTYDTLGNLTQVSKPGGQVITYTVDGRGRRVRKSIDGVPVKGWLYADQLRPIAELDGDGVVVSRFVYGTKPNVPEYVVKNGETYRIVSDHIGTPRLVVHATTGAVVQRLDVQPFGEIIVDTNPGWQPFGFAGGLYDPDTGLVRFGARDYDPRTGRWTAKDPIGFESDESNLYSYVGGEPVSRVDSSGLEWVYEQSTGRMWHVNESTGVIALRGVGYAGHGLGVNNPEYDFVRRTRTEPNAGPLPQGTYTILKQGLNITVDGRRLPGSMRLVPHKGNTMYGRSGFLIHGDNRAQNRTASTGCPILPPRLRDIIGNSGDDILRVVR